MFSSIYYFILLGLAFVLISLYLFRRLIHITTGSLFFGLAGIVVGALIGALLSVPLGKLPGLYGQWLPLIVTIILAVLVAYLFVFQKKRVSEWFFFRFIHQIEERLLSRRLELSGKERKKIEKERGGIVVDTSVIIDGRIGDIAKTGFIGEKLIVPRFVLEELQNIADSDDSLRRNRGRRGLEILNELSKEAQVEVEIVEERYPKIKEVDHKLVRLAKDRKAKILTTDYNLNQVADIEKVKVLNVNELSNAIKTVVLPGEELKVKIIQEGKEEDQGVGYLEDGTMIVVEGGARFIGQEIDCVVERIFQTVAGRMIFVKPKQEVEDHS